MQVVLLYKLEKSFEYLPIELDILSEYKKLKIAYNIIIKTICS